MKYSIVDPSAAPPRPVKARQGKLAQQFNELIDALVPSNVARIEPDDNERLQILRNLLYERAARLGKRIDPWEHEGALYVRLVHSDSASVPPG